jgi:hypothetical protein
VRNSTAGFEWWWLLSGASLTLIPVGALITRWGAIRASHPAYFILLCILAAVGLLLTWRGIGSPERPRPPSRIATRVALGVLVVVFGGIAWWLRPLAATDIAVDALVDDVRVTVTQSSTRIDLDPREETRPVELVFYPGALVDPRAYVDILRPIAETGYPVTIIKPPLGIAFLAQGSTTDRALPGTVVGGHSLGGVVAANDASGEDGIDGLLLWAAYPATSLADQRDLQSMSIFGSEDGLTTPADVAESEADLPASTRFVEITGAVHAFFGDYGDQRGDGTPTISRDEAQAQIIAATLQFLDAVSRRIAP